MKREPLQTRDLRSTQALPFAALATAHQATTRCTSLDGSASVGACAWPGYLRRDVGDGSRLCENSDVELARRISVSISSLSKPIAPATSLRRRQLRKQFCASLTQASFHTGWVIKGHRGLTAGCPLRPPATDITQRLGFQSTTPGRRPAH